MTHAPIHRRTVLKAGAAGVSLFALPAPLTAQSLQRKAPMNNPLIFQRADPHILRSRDGSYFFTASVPEYDRIILRQSDSIAGLASAHEMTVWQRPTDGPMGGHIWAPEIHQVNERWLIYFAAGNSDDVFHIRTYVMGCTGEDPMRDAWELLGQLETPWDSFNLDATYFHHAGGDYLCWAQREPGIETNSNLYLAPLAGPTRFSAPPVRLSVPTLDWEIHGFRVNEGAAFLAHGDRVFIAYSASATDDRYVMGLLWADADADLMRAENWTKSQEPVFASAPDRCIYGPGHNSFTLDTDGRHMIVYHARDYRDIVGDPLYDPNRHARVQYFDFDAAGMPVFGQPVANGPLHQ